MRRISSGRNGGTGGRQRRSKWRIVTWSIAPAASRPLAVSRTASSIFDFLLRIAIHLHQLPGIKSPRQRFRLEPQQLVCQLLQRRLLVFFDVVPLVLSEAVHEEPAILQIRRHNRPKAASFPLTGPSNTLLDEVS